MVWDYILYNMDKFVYSLSLLFIWVEWNQYSKKSLTTGDKNHLKLLFFSISKLINILVLFIGLFTPLWILYLLVILFENSKMIILMNLNPKNILWYTPICSIIYTIIYLIIFIQGVFL